MVMANLLSLEVQKDISEEKIQKFREKLTELLLQGENEGRWKRECDVDYHPNDILSEACEYSNISSSCLPIKTFTTIEKDNSVTGRYQYGGEFFKL